MKINPIPEGWHSITPCLMVEDALRLIDFLKQAFAGTEQARITHPNGAVVYAEVRLGDALVLVTEPDGQWKPRPSSVIFYVPDVDTAFRRALAAGAKSVREPANMFYGDRQACVRDIADNDWWITTRIEDLSMDEIQKRAVAFYKQQTN
jgi:PhnB protein